MNDSDLMADLRTQIDCAFLAWAKDVEGLRVENAALRAVLREYVEMYPIRSRTSPSKTALEDRARALMGEKL